MAVARLLGAHHDASVGSRVAPPFVAIAVLVVAAAMVAINQAVRKIPIQYAQRKMHATPAPEAVLQGGD
ncbi:MAG: hypothetical protein EBV53_16335 [Proteobacteria bacterium]|nr:hypothetical protein [Pseudomonadota bacterium]